MNNLRTRLDRSPAAEPLTALEQRPAPNQLRASPHVSGRDQRGMCTAEYAVGTVAACGFACVLLELLENWRSMLANFLLRAVELHVGWSFPWPW
jgi:uncharacterized protein DUF4244